MYLKSIEVHGFKSFANKITFNFNNGITGIVGPNGSGKSNVADAVRWVLGEQSVKQLRGSSMQDVIFSGTETRKPMGYAYVSITLDNSDHALPIAYEEVTVSRRVYRSGESEYLINGSTSRLKDIKEMFYDTGIGKEGYSIIGQGQIDKILSGKPEERRELFDEAAGIVKFKRRKDSALKKLENERNNLVRVNDILSVLEEQVEPLSKQAEIAKDYLKKKEDLKNLDINLFLLDSERIESELTSLTDKLKIATKDLSETQEKHENIKKEYADIEAKIEALDEEIEEKRNKLSSDSVIREKLEGEIKVLEEKINTSKIEASHFEDREKALESEYKLREAEHSKISGAKKEIDDSLAEVIKERDSAKAELAEVQKRIEELSSAIEKGKNDIITTINDRATIKTKITEFDTLLSQHSIHRAEIQSKLLKAKSEEAELDKILKDYLKELNDINAEILEADKNQEHLSEQLYVLRRDLEERDGALIDAQNSYHKELSKLEALKNITERYDGYGHSVKSVMEQKDSVKGLIGVVADIISTDKKYETAIETALGGNIQNIVTKDEADAKQMIAYLKEHKLGRATFLPLTTVKPRGEYKYSEIKNEKGFIGIASEIVKADSKYDSVVSQLLGEIAIVDTVDNALAMAKKHDYKLRLVTLEGEYLAPGGSLAGGSFKNNSNLLGRRREIEELEKAVEKAKKHIEDCKKDIEDTKAKRNKVREESESLKETQKELYLKQNTAQLNYDSMNSKIAETKEGYSNLEKENLDMEGIIKELTGNKSDTQTKLSESEKTEKDIEKMISEYGKELEELREKESHKVVETTDLDLKVQGFSQKVEFETQNLKRVEDELTRINSEKAELSEKKSVSDEEIEAKKKDIEKLKETIVASENSKSEDEEALKKVIAEKTEFTAKQKTFFDTREELSNKAAELDKEVYRLNTQKEKLEDSQQGLVSYMFNEYEITLSQARSLRDETLTDINVIRRGINNLKDAIRKLGDVNVNAIEDYKDLMERYTFLKTQHDDLVKAEETLVAIIEDLDTSMRNQFNEKFIEISKEYDKVFKEMFGGGKGTLELEQDVDVLEAGIKIIAQPPGKKLQNMMQLSGGEKALTAIALLFAIQNLKPSPFCLLDEIEAALDESNVGRFAGYLHKLTKHTQFIVITHRRGTMEEADRLYGITMQEKGVSALVSVNLVDKDLDN
ncbi:MAG: chromosome segregation protein SMC [Lachnospiraceae bacterium]|nr:chromosome segregation protein SMC [Lachnospiraceae bacterium]